MSWRFLAVIVLVMYVRWLYRVVYRWADEDHPGDKVMNMILAAVSSIVGVILTGVLFAVVYSLGYWVIVG